MPFASQLALAVVDADRARTHHARPPHPARDDSRMRCETTASRQDAGCAVHAGDVLRRGLDPHEDDRAVLGHRHRVLGAEGDLPGCRARTGRKSAAEETTARQHLLFLLRVEHRREELHDLPGLDARNRFRMIDQPFVDHVACDFHRGEAGPFAGACLQEIELAGLDRELDVLHVAVMPFEFSEDVRELCVDLGHHLFKRFTFTNDIRLRDR